VGAAVVVAAAVEAGAAVVVGAVAEVLEHPVATRLTTNATAARVRAPGPVLCVV
jgi:hypothetical protein